MSQNNINTDLQYKLKLLFIARTYPPLVGGMEKFASDFYHNMQDHLEIDLIANRIGKKRIVHFFFKVFFYLIFNARNYQIIHFNDAILAPLIPAIRLFSSAKVTLSVHGLDIVYRKFAYQYLVIPFLYYADRIFPVSQFTKDRCIDRKINPGKLKVIPNGLDFSNLETFSPPNRELLLKKISIEIENKCKLLSVGRLIKRKGHTWFIENVFSKLPEHFVYLIAGAGPESEDIKSMIHKYSLSSRVQMLGYVTEAEKICLYNIADLFIMPNITDQNDQEGFGIVLLEAGSYGLPSIATGIEGITDAVIPGVTGTLVNEKDSHEFINAITKADFNRQSIMKNIRQRYDLKAISKEYFDEFIKLTS